MSPWDKIGITEEEYNKRLAEKSIVHLTAQEVHDATSGPAPIGLQEAAKLKLAKWKAKWKWKAK